MERFISGLMGGIFTSATHTKAAGKAFVLPPDQADSG